MPSQWIYFDVDPRGTAGIIPGCARNLRSGNVIVFGWPDPTYPSLEFHIETMFKSSPPDVKKCFAPLPCKVLSSTILLSLRISITRKEIEEKTLEVYRSAIVLVANFVDHRNRLTENNCRNPRVSVRINLRSIRTFVEDGGERTR